MKLNSFFDKDKVPLRREGDTINVNNEYREAKLQTSIDTLNKEIERLTQIENEHRALRKTHSVVQEQLVDAQRSVHELEESKLRSTQDVLYYEKKMKDIPALQEESESWRHESNSFKNKYFDVSATVTKQGELIQNLEGQRNSLQSENTSLAAIANQAELDTSALNDEFQVIKTQYEEIAKKFGKMSKIYIDTKRNNNSLKDEREYWETLARSVQIELESKEELSNQLRNWIGQLETKQNKTNVKAQDGDTKVNDLQLVVTDMAKSLEDLAAERDYLNEMNDKLKYQLSKAGYASVGAIAKKEGFKMSLANSAINWNKNYLGTARPTLLKFKHREEKHDHS